MSILDTILYLVVRDDVRELDHLRQENARLSRLCETLTAQREAAEADKAFYYRLYCEARKERQL